MAGPDEVKSQLNIQQLHNACCESVLVCSYFDDHIGHFKITNPLCLSLIRLRYLLIKRIKWIFSVCLTHSVVNFAILFSPHKKNLARFLIKMSSPEQKTRLCFISTSELNWRLEGAFQISSAVCPSVHFLQHWLTQATYYNWS